MEAFKYGCIVDGENFCARFADVSTPTTIKRSLTALANAGLIYDIGEGYKFISPFFREWIRRQK